MSGPTTAFITGATEGIGRAIALSLGRQGYRIGVCARREATLELLLTELEAQGIDAAGMPADVGKEEDVARVVDHVQGTLGAIEVLINNAGIALLHDQFAVTVSPDGTRAALDGRERAHRLGEQRIDVDDAARRKLSRQHLLEYHRHL